MTEIEPASGTEVKPASGMEREPDSRTVAEPGSGRLCFLTENGTKKNVQYMCQCNVGNVLSTEYHMIGRNDD
jgi:hypothetical protein